MADYISREAAIKAAKCHYPKANEMIAGIILVPAADVVARDCYDRILAENDTMREMLARIGKKCGDSMDDVRPVVRGKWVRGNENRTSPIKDSYICSVCGEKTLSGFCGNPAKTNFCPNCGAYMEKMITGKEENGRT